MYSHLTDNSETTRDVFIDQALQFHSTISLEAGKQFLNNILPHHQLKEVLAMIDRLDMILETPNNLHVQYDKAYQELCEVLEDIGLSTQLM